MAIHPVVKLMSMIVHTGRSGHTNADRAIVDAVLRDQHGSLAVLFLTENSRESTHCLCEYDGVASPNSAKQHATNLALNTLSSFQNATINNTCVLPCPMTFC